MKKKLLCTVLSATMVAAMLAGCGSSDSGNNTDTQQPAQSQEQQPAADDTQQSAADTQTPASGEGKVYYLNFKPEQGDRKSTRLNSSHP